MRLAALIIVIVGCGAPEIPIGEINQRLAEADCARYVRCGVYLTQADCMRFARPLAPVTPSIAGAVAAGLVDYDPVEAAECVDERTAMSCSSADADVRLADTSTVCRGLLRAGRKIGDPCTLGAECATRKCSFDGAVFPSEVCPIGGHCAEADHHAARGESCADNPCAPNLQCETGLCEPLLPRGSPCFSPSDCDFGLTCFGTCVPPPKLGEPCGDSPFFNGSCGFTIGVACDPATMTCEPLPRAGDLCEPGFGADHCAGGLWCDPTTNACTPLPRVGASCLRMGRCDAGAYCKTLIDEGDAICLPFVDDGSPCVSANECKSGTCSSAGICIQPPVCT